MVYVIMDTKTARMHGKRKRMIYYIINNKGFFRGSNGTYVIHDEHGVVVYGDVV